MYYWLLLHTIVRESVCNRVAKTPEKLDGKDFFLYTLNNSVLFLITKVIYIQREKFSEIQKSTQTHKLSTISSPRDNNDNILAFCLLIFFMYLFNYLTE